RRQSAATRRLPRPPQASEKPSHEDGRAVEGQDPRRGRRRRGRRLVPGRHGLRGGRARRVAHLRRHRRAAHLRRRRRRPGLRRRVRRRHGVRLPLLLGVHPYGARFGAAARARMLFFSGICCCGFMGVPVQLRFLVRGL
uniref:Uncharacterized protein n=1 Tax=Triticum urartu TaxID=4572 RepID=A0A8R7PUA6_TRIUA